MHEPDFWTDCAKAMELSLEGQRLIAAEVAEVVSSRWARAMRWIDPRTRTVTDHRNLPRA